MESSIALFYRQMEHLLRGSIVLAPKLFIAFLVIPLFAFGSRFTSKLVEKVIRKRRQGRYHSVAMLLGRMVRVAVLGFGILVALSIVVPTFKASDLINFLGVGGVAVGFAFRDILQNFFAGIIIICSRVFDEGDHITTGEISGEVEQIQMRSTFVRTSDGQRIVVPNALLINREVRLKNAYDAKRTDVEIALKTSDDLRKCLTVISTVLKNNSKVGKQPAPIVSVEHFSGDFIFVKLAWWLPLHGIDSVEVKNEVLSEVNLKLNQSRQKLAVEPSGKVLQFTHP